MTGSSSRRRRRRRRRQPISLLAVLIGGGLCLLLGALENGSQGPPAACVIRTVPESYSFAGYRIPVSREAYPRRAVFPYSVIPGGAHDRTELVREIAHDPVVAAHYADFDAPNTRVVRVKDAKLVHVSYRVDDKVFWTSKKIKLPQGEALLSDGQNLARTRCGNRVSVEPQEPTSAEEPPPEVFETPLIPVDDIPLLAPTLDANPAGELEPTWTALPSLVESPELLTLGERLFEERFTPSFPPPYFPPLYVVTEHFPDIPGVPEPGTLILLGSGLAAQVWIFRLWRKRRGRNDPDA